MAFAIPPIAAPNIATYTNALAAWSTGDPTDMTFPANGNDLIFIWNTHATETREVTITSTADAYNRTRDITMELAASTMYTAGPLDEQGWADSNGLITITPSDTDVMVMVYQL